LFDDPLAGSFIGNVAGQLQMGEVPENGASFCDVAKKCRFFNQLTEWHFRVWGWHGRAIC